MLEKVLMVPYKIEGGQVLFFIGKRPETEIWQFPTGHVGDNIKSEGIIDAVKRELSEELGIKDYRNFINTKTSFYWKKDVKVRENIFAFDITKEEIKLEKAEFSNFKFLNLVNAKQILTHESHRKIVEQIYKIIKNRDYPKIFIVCGPGGSGKKVVLEKLTQQTGLTRAKTVTTRARRPLENDAGRKFIKMEEFKKLSDNDRFIEKNFFWENWYGSIKDEVEGEIENGRSVLIEVELNGVKSFKKKYTNVIAIFLTIDIKNLEQRMRRRGGEDEKRINERLKIARVELKRFSICDYKVENKEGKLDETIKKIIRIIRKEKGVRNGKK